MPRGKSQVVDGQTGRVKDATVDGKAAKIDSTPRPTQEELVQVPLETLVHDYNVLEKRRAAAASQRGSWGAKLKDLIERIEPILAEIRRRDDAVHEKAGEQSTLEDAAINRIRAAAEGESE